MYFLMTCISNYIYNKKPGATNGERGLTLARAPVAYRDNDSFDFGMSMGCAASNKVGCVFTSMHVTIIRYGQNETYPLQVEMLH